MKQKIKIVSKQDIEKGDLDYWLDKSSEAKLNTLQELREQYINLFNKKKLYNESRKALRRVYKITKLS
jgi:tRNA uridine 5-carbamoylmethylation protein Kti12